MTSQAPHLVTGKSAECAANHYLQRQGLKLLAHNYHSRYGEIDLIMQEDKQLVFVEVRYRKNQRYGHAAETITRAKQKKLIKTAQVYLQKSKLLNRVSCRFDIVALSDQQTQWIKHAFEVQ